MVNNQIYFGGIFMGRKSKCSPEEKQRAVEDYLNGIRSVADIMNHLLISSTRSIRNWTSIYEERDMMVDLLKKVKEFERRRF